MEAAWAGYMRATKTETIESLAAEGWKDSRTLSRELGIPETAGRQRFARDPRLEQKKAGVVVPGAGRRTLNFFRPRVSG